ncbi:MAG: double-strand break repair protein AddB, partial [Rhizobiaceae bacterium]
GGEGLPRRPAPEALSLLRAEPTFRPGEASALVVLLPHPLLFGGEPGAEAGRRAAFAELVLLRGGAGSPDIETVSDEFDTRLLEMNADRHAPFWLSRMEETDIAGIRQLLSRLCQAVKPLREMREKPTLELEHALVEMVRAYESIGRDEEGAVDGLYSGDNGEAFAAVLNSLIAAAPDTGCRPEELPDILGALLATETVKPGSVSDGRIAIWGVLEARLQNVDTMIVAGLNEGSWPRKAETGRFMSRVLSGGMGLEPPERRTGQAAHDFQMAMGAKSVIMSRSERADGAPASRSRWLQRLLAVVGEQAVAEMKQRGDRYLNVATAIDDEGIGETTQIYQPCPAPPFDARPRRFSVTEIETLRRDPYAVYARRILKLEPVDPLLRDPGAAERGSLFHEILHQFTRAEIDVLDVEAEAKLLEIAGKCFDSAGLPADIRAVWWPRFVKQAPRLIEWEREQIRGVAASHSEIAATAISIGETGAFLSGRADRIDVLDGGQAAEILDYKTGNTPSKVQAHRLLSPQLALEGELLARGAFGQLGAVRPADLKFVRLKPDGRVEEESILEIRDSLKTAEQLSQEAWQRLNGLIAYYTDETNGYRSRALPLREHDLDGDYDHLARVSEWSSGASSNGGDAP